MGVSQADARRVAEKLGALHTFKKCIIEIRGCNIGATIAGTDVLPDHRAAFGKMTTAPKCRMLYFVLPVMWDDADMTFHLPLEAGYGAKLRIIP